MAKDLFSEQAGLYAKYRPTYPPELFDYILSFVHNRDTAWDCATGNGQAATVLADFFQHVEATDISEAQLQNAVPKNNIHYQIASAEQTSFADNSFDLITVATAYHWLNWKAFREEAIRVGRPEAVVAVWGYNIVQCEDAAIDEAIRRFYYDVVYAYWDKERRYVEQSYATVDFDFMPLPSKEFSIDCRWSREEFLGYVSSWSSVQHYREQQNESPLPILQNDLENIWPAGEVKAFRFPLFLKIGRVTK